MARTPSISDIKSATSRTAPFFFSRDTLKFFGQSMSSFRVKKSPKGNIFIFAKIVDGLGKQVGYTFMQFKNGDLLSIRAPHNTQNDVLRYIARH